MKKYLLYLQLVHFKSPFDFYHLERKNIINFLVSKN